MSHFPDMVESLVLIAPSGLIRVRHFSKTSRVIYSEGVIPEPVLLSLVRRRLKTPLYPPKKQADENLHATDAVKAEVNIENNSQAALSKSHPNVTIEGAVVHQVDHHEAFVPAFMSSIRYGPIQSQHSLWERIGQHLALRNQGSKGSGKVLIICGDRDPIIDKEELREDANAVLDRQIEFYVLPAGHDVPIVKSRDVSDLIWKHWNA